VRRHAKASSAGSTQATGSSRGLLRRASVTSSVSTQHIATPAAGERGPDSTASTTPSRAAATADVPALFSVSAPHPIGTTRTTTGLRLGAAA
jgi:hypothetical protein